MRKILGMISNFTLQLNKDKSILILLWLFHLINNYIWLNMDNYPLLWDAGAYYLDSLILFDYIKHLSIPSLLNVIKVGGQYPPFVPFLVSLSYIIFNRTEDVAVFIGNGIFLGILICSIYGITKNIYNKKSGVLAAFLVTMYPIIFGHSRIFMYDLPVTAVVCLSIYIFQKTDNFKKIGYSLLFGITFGLGLLTKFSFLLFSTSAIFYYGYRNCSKVAGYILKGRFFLSMRSYLKQIKNLFIATLIAAILASIWYVPNFARFLQAIFIYPETCRKVSPLTFSFASISYYFFRSINYQISFFLFLIFVIGLFYFIRLRLKNKLFLIFWVLFSYIGCTLENYKSPRYTMPYLPAIAIISSIGLMSIRHKKSRVIVTTIVVIISVVQFLAYSYGAKLLPSFLKVDFPTKFVALSNVNSIILFNQKGGDNPLEQNTIFKKGDWKTEEILDVIVNSSGDIKNKSINVFIIPDDPRIHSPLASLAYLKKLPFAFHVGSCEHISVSRRDVVITKDGNWMVPPYFMEKINQSVNWFAENIDKFTLIKKIKLPDNSNLLIYKQN